MTQKREALPDVPCKPRFTKLQKLSSVFVCTRPWSGVGDLDHAIIPVQQMAIMTPWCDEVREKLPLTLRYLPVMRKPFRIEQLVAIAAVPVLPLLF
jgi:hypothetical protein